MNKLLAHFEKMQDMARRYIMPEPYVERDGNKVNVATLRDDAFIRDMIYMLDGPEQREAQADEGKSWNEMAEIAQDADHA